LNFVNSAFRKEKSRTDSFKQPPAKNHQ